MRQRSIQFSSASALLVAVDVLLLFGTLLLAFVLRTLQPAFLSEPGWVLDIRTGGVTLTILVHLVCFYVFELYNPVINFRRAAGAARIIAAILVATGMLIVLYYILPMWRISRGVVLIHAGLVALVVGSLRLWLAGRRQVAIKRTRALIIGAGRMGRLAVEAVHSRPDRAIDIVGFLDDNAERQEQDIQGYGVLGRTEAVGDVVEAQDVDMVIIAIRQPREAVFAKTVLDLKSQGMQVVHASTLYKFLTGRVPFLYVDDFYFLFGRDIDRVRDPVLRNFHRLFDLTVSSVALLLSSPLLLTGMLLVAVTSRGPIFYRQERVGLNKRRFQILKLRTMRVDAERETGAVMSQPGRDSRVTPVGRLLRRSRVDELPQFLNIFKGDMSFIGPRPERPEFTEEFEKEIPYYGLRSAVKPGLTGWAQVNFRYGSDASDTAVKLQYDLYYIQEMSLLLDVHILLKTVQTVLFRSGS